MMIELRRGREDQIDERGHFANHLYYYLRNHYYPRIDYSKIIMIINLEHNQRKEKESG